MAKIHKEQKGFSIVEVLVVIVVVIVIGFAAWHLGKNSSRTDSHGATGTHSAPSKAAPSTPLKLADAVAQAQADYALYTKEVANGQVLQDQSQWSKDNVMAAEDLQFMNNNKSLFTGSFISSAMAFKYSGAKANYNGYLECLDALSNNDFTVLGVNLSGKEAYVTVSYTSTAAKTLHKPWPVTLEYQNGSWLISSVDLRPQYCG